MKRTLLICLVSAGVWAQPALTQMPGGAPGQAPATMPGRTAPGQTPGINGPLDQNTTTPSKVDDKKFAKEAVLDGMTEIQIGKLAADKASRDDVKQFGQKMVDDHTKANDQLKQLASRENIPVPDALDSKHQSQVDKLSKLSGEQFDKAFVKDQLKDHQAAVRDFGAEAQGGTDADLKKFASSTLPTLQEHLQMVKDLSKGEKNTADRQAKVK